tara:strand:+ start:38905 stop:39081 length:177 start_codon:yes stop_codon:yes gene_type:complete
VDQFFTNNCEAEIEDAGITIANQYYVDPVLHWLLIAVRPIQTISGKLTPLEKGNILTW